jgi:threonine dehydratase
MTLLATPLERAPDTISRGHVVYLKREDVHQLGAFKWRGALPTLEGYAAANASIVVTASTGNHGAATAWAARRLGLSAIVYAPEGTSRTKLALMGELGAEIRLHGVDVDEAKDEASAWARTQAVPFFEDGAEPAQLDGYAAIAHELLDQLSESPAAVVVPVGNGALLAGIGRTLREHAPTTLRVGVAADEAPVMVESWRAARPVESDRSGTFADGLAVRVAIPFAVAELQSAAQRMLLVSERELARAVAAFWEIGIRAEGAAAAGLAALDQLDDVDGTIVLVVTGGNIDDALMERVLSHPEGFPE